MEGFSTQQQYSSALPYCVFEPLLGFPVRSGLEAAMAYERSSSSCSSLDTSSAMAMVYSPMAMQLHLHESTPLEAAAAPGGSDDKRRMVDTQGSSTTSLGSTQEKDGSGGKIRKKQKRSNVDVKEKRARGHAGETRPPAPAPAAAGYIHVRARRGQATDSHSLAERLRREKISERMKMLQSLVPSCDKVTGKAQMLDEIINYVQSLQNQVEFLTMKLASLNPVLYEFGLDIDMYPALPQLVKMAQMPHELLQCMGQQGNLLTTGAGHVLVEEAQGPTGFGQEGFSSSHMSVMKVGEQAGQEDQVDMDVELSSNSMCFFH